MLEEVLAAGAPVSSHWIADRQSGPLLLRFGTEEQRERFLPPITRGESFYCIAMSAPDSGSDLASIRRRALRGDGGWIVDAPTIWPTPAQMAHYMCALLRPGLESNTTPSTLSTVPAHLQSPRPPPPHT